MPHLLQVYKQENTSSDATLPNIPFLLASGNFPEKAVTPADYDYIVVDCVNLWLPAPHYSYSYKAQTAECSLYLQFNRHKILGKVQAKGKT